MKITIKNSVAKRIEKDLNALKKKKILVGVISNDPDTPKKNGMTIRRYAELNEYGTVFIPARPFFRTATQTRKSKRLINARLDLEIKKVIKGEKNPDQALNAVGLYVKGRIQKSIKSGNWTPNAPSTRRRKATLVTVKNRKTKQVREFTKLKPPLIDTGDMFKSIDYQIKDK